jgi:hypothetical protein
MSVSSFFRRISRFDVNLNRAERVGRGERQQELMEREAVVEQQQEQPRASAADLVRQNFIDNGELRKVQEIERVIRDLVAPPLPADDVDVDDVGADAAAGNDEAVRRSPWYNFYKVTEDEHYLECITPAELGNANQTQSHQKNISLRGGTGMLRRHIENMHPTTYAKFNELVASGTAADAAAAAVLKLAAEASTKRKSVWAQGPTKEESRLTQEILLFAWAIDKGISFAAVESPFFKEYHKITGWTQPPNRDRFGGVLLEQAYAVCLNKLKADLAAADFFAITTDAWTSEVKEKFVAVTVHFIPLPEYTLKSHVLSVIPLNEAHTWQKMTRAIALRISNALPSDSVLVSTVTDNGANFVKLARSLHSNLELAAVDDDEGSWDEPLPADNDAAADVTATWRCVAHRAQLAVDDAIEVIGNGLRDAIDAARGVVRFVRSSSGRRANLVKVQQAAKRDLRVPQLDVATRWSSMWMMLSSFTNLEDDFTAMALAGMLTDDEDSVVLPTRAQVRQIKHLVETLAPLAEFIRLAEGEYYCTLAVVPVLLRRCFNSIGDVNANMSSELRQFKEQLLDQVNRRLGYILATPNLALAAAALHPAYGHLRFVSSAVRDEMWRELAVWVTQFPRGAHPAAAAAVADDGMIMPEATPTVAEITGQLNGVRGVFEHQLAPVDPLELRSRDALAWWKKNWTLAVSPAINHLARIIHCIPATSAPSERVFSSSGLLATATRAALHADKVEMCTIVRGVMRSFASAGDFAAVVAAHAAQLKEQEAHKRPRAARRAVPVAAAAGNQPQALEGAGGAAE